MRCASAHRIGSADDGARVSGCQLALGKHRLHLLGKLKKPRLVFATWLRLLPTTTATLVLGLAELLRQPRISPSFLDG